MAKTKEKGPKNLGQRTSGDLSGDEKQGNNERQCPASTNLQW